VIEVSSSSGVLRRALKNAGLLLTGKAAAGFFQLCSFALAARGLGLSAFGVFSIILAQVQLLTGLAAFQSNQAVVRYGVAHLKSDDRVGFQEMLKAGTLLDVSAASLAMIGSVVLAPFFGRQLDWDDGLISMAQFVSVLALTNAIATPKGLLRLFGRFDLLAQHAVVTPLARLIGVGACYASGAALPIYLAAWIAGGLLGAIVAVWLGWREVRRRGLLQGMRPSVTNLSQQNEGIWGFSILANFHSSIALIPSHLGTLLVGMILTPAAAGLYKIAQEVGTGLAKPVELLNQSVYPDVARIVSAGEWHRLTRTVLYAGLIAGGASGLITVLVIGGGRPIIAAFFGEAYLSTFPVLILIQVAVTVSVLVFAIDAALYSLGRPSRPLTTALLANLVFAGVLIWRLPLDGLSGAGFAYLGSSLVTFTLSIFWYRRELVVARRGDIRR
jgi:O-antigen/teichoic acid export membrane protein